MPALTADPAALRDRYEPLELHAAIVAAMTAEVDGDARRARAVEAFTAWFGEHVPPAGDEGLLANAMADLVDGDPTVAHVTDAAARLAMSTRTLQRLATRYVGLSPLAMIRRRRLQEAAERLRTDPGTEIAAVAADLGYSDHAHLTSAFRTVLGFTPSSYRGAASGNG